MRTISTFEAIANARLLYFADLTTEQQEALEKVMKFIEEVQQDNNDKQR